MFIILFPIDRVQLVNGELYAYEFIDLNKKKAVDIQQEKVNNLIKSNYFEKVIQIEYSSAKIEEDVFDFRFNNKKNSSSYQNVKYISNHTPAKDFNHASNLLKMLNRKSVTSSGEKSKKLGSVGNSKISEGDIYVKGLLRELYKESEEIVNFVTHDDNGIEVTKKLLGSEPTYGFDFDLYSMKNNIIIEFLKRENEHITNKTAHPNRYIGRNINKFKSLWEATEIIRGELFLINYSDNENEEINIIHVHEIDFNKQKPMINHDTGYILKDRDELLKWLETIKTKGSSYLSFLNDKPCQERDQEFWKKPDWKRKLFL